MPINSSVLTGITCYPTVVDMFERFTSEARRSIVLAQEEARRLQHNYIGTEHLLLGLLAEPNGIASAAAARFGLNLSTGRDDVTEIIGIGQKPLKGGHIPFTPRAKKSLELALREALQLGHDYIGPEHVVLGIAREGEGVAAQILIKHAGDLATVRTVVTDMLPPSAAGPTQRWLRRRFGASASAGPVPLRPEQQPELRTTPSADISLSEAARLAGQSPVGSHHILLAVLADTDSAAARTLAAHDVDLEHLREALLTADVIGSSDELPEEAGRRQMLIRVAGDHITVEASDAASVALGRTALEALAARAAEHGQQAGNGGAEGIVRGDDPLGASLSLVWQALHECLEDIRRRAVAARDAPPATPGQAAAAGG
jgi:ATP-dependent Clp protease ATP-binding subunit ClpA